MMMEAKRRLSIRTSSSETMGDVYTVISSANSTFLIPVVHLCVCVVPCTLSYKRSGVTCVLFTVRAPPAVWRKRRLLY